MAATWQRLGDAVGCTTIGANRVRIEPGRLSTPPHSHGASEEIVFVLGGSGLSWQDEQVYELRPGDCIVHLADREEHTLRGGPEGLDVIICGTRHPTELGWLPRSRAIRLGWPWVEGRTDDPWDVEAQAEPLEFGEPAPRPKNIVNVDEADVLSLEKDDSALDIRYIAREAGADRTGMRHYTIPPGKLDGEPHCHAAEVEFFLVLEGAGSVLLGDDEIPLQPGSFVGRPPGTGVAHAFRGPLTLLTYGTNEPNEICYYPRSKLLKFWGVDAQIAAEPLTRYWPSEMLD
ncbi:MAG TPA: cupin domain-containing protein [Gaiellaceae bacterium]|nr:cupin domain-containing protein [Gaiellaceae bacterium]